MTTPINILLLEDNADDAELLLMELKTHSFDVTWERVETEEDFVSKLSPSLDIILADYTVPQFNAPNALKRLQEKEYDVPFIVVTGSISEETAVEVMKQGAADYLLKDRLSRLGEAIRHALTQRKLREEKASAERNLRVMDYAIHSSINAVAMADLDGKINFVNQAFLDLWGYKTHNEVLNQSILTLWENQRKAGVVESMLKKNQNLQSEMRVHKVDGTEMILQFSTSSVLDEHKEPICVMAVFSDITEQKKSEQAQREAEILRIQLEKEKELRDLKSRFMSMVIHDFRNPLAVMQLQLDSLLRYYDRFNREKKEASINLTLNQIQHLNQLMDDVLAISRLESSEARFHPESGNFVEFCKDVVEDFQDAIGASHAIHYQPNCTAIMLEFDSQLMRRALTNLLSNAMKYSPENSTVHFTLNLIEKEISVGVTDEGIGIPEEDQKRLFDAFHRASNVGTIEGTGLGLAIVKHVIDLHGGSVNLSSEVNKGTTFIIKIPCKK